MIHSVHIATIDRDDHSISQSFIFFFIEYTARFRVRGLNTSTSWWLARLDYADMDVTALRRSSRNS